VETHYKTIHLGRGFKCEFCPVMFTTKITVLKHMDFEHPEKTPEDSAHVCEICGQRFRNKGNMTTHKSNTHSQKKKKRQYTTWCKICHRDVDKIKNEDGLILSNNQSMLRHYKMLHAEDIMKCPGECHGQADHVKK
jgi:transcription elongation factor Elf1